MEGRGGVSEQGNIGGARGGRLRGIDTRTETEADMIVSVGLWPERRGYWFS